DQANDATPKEDTDGYDDDRVLTACPPGRVSCLCFEPDGRAVAFATGQDVFLWNPAGPSEWRRFPQPAAVRDLTFAPHGNLLLLGGEDGTAWFWDMESGRPGGALDWGSGRSTPSPS